MLSNSVELDESKKLEIEEKLKSWTAENEEVNILKIDHEQFQTSHIPGWCFSPWFRNIYVKFHVRAFITCSINPDSAEQGRD